ncbi:hypothetical protein DPMN_053610 [Dreissena polymorpha]|uniref:Uncharacterized protein n=1 Tax=Dreissena polymorpha TaxID=45954 RepID=A0A9D4CLN6_DREPO|nr:hypothetical protein DPMN_053610 [Dreissena polymorpha]
MDTYTGERMVRRLKISKTYRIPFRASVCDGCVGLLVLMSETGDSTSYIQVRCYRTSYIEAIVLPMNSRVAEVQTMYM